MGHLKKVPLFFMDLMEVSVDAQITSKCINPPTQQPALVIPQMIHPQGHTEVAVALPASLILLPPNRP